ncbi:MAG TPA: hypothetical protein VMV71_02775 [Candidatus Paceibacterota bacterium]|nr:hypothetical protein [Candidatus Paceibacterota bacterium]
MDFEQESAENKSPHILNTSANLLGFTFIVLSSIKGLGLAQNGIADKIAGACVVLFALSSFISFASMKTISKTRSNNYETFADYLFLMGLTLCVVLSFLLVFYVAKI